MERDEPLDAGDAAENGRHSVEFTDRYSTGVVSFDSVLKGGVPVGSLVLMLTDEGAGAREFAFTSAAKLSLVQDRPDMKQFVFGDFYSRMQFPEQITYVSMARSREDVMMEIEASFNRDLAQAFKEHVRFLDFSPAYFKGSRVPISWIQDSTGADTLCPEVDQAGSDVDEMDLFFVDVVEQYAKGGVLIVDSLTDIIVHDKIDNQQLMLGLKGLQRILHSWRGVVFFILHKGVLFPVEEARFKDCFDAVMNFEWVRSVKSSKRQRYLYFEKFGGVMPMLDRESIIRFSTEVSHTSGFVVVNAERIV